MKTGIDQKFKLSKSRLLKSAAVALLSVGFVVLLLESWIWFDVNKYSHKAERKFHLGRIESLLAMIDSPEFTLDQKNMAIWTLGIIKDPKALPKLESMVTGKPCHHASEICQYELKKAILKTKGVFKWSGDVKKFEHVK